MRQNNKGFTLVEMLVVAPLVILLVGSFIYAIVTFTGQSMVERSKAVMLNDIQGALDEIEDDVASSGAYLATNNVTLTSPQGVDNATQAFVSNSTDNDSLILNTFVTSESPLSPTRTLVYLANMPNACGSANFNQNQVMTMNVVYFVKDSTLWRRTLAINNYASKDCTGQTIFQRPSCAPGITGSLCETQDERLLSGVSSAGFSVTYYPSASSTTVVANATNGNVVTRQTALDTATTVKISITASGIAAGRDFTQSGAARMTRNGTLVKAATS